MRPEAIFAVHLRKEEEAYLPQLEAHLTDFEQQGPRIWRVRIGKVA